MKQARPSSLSCQRIQRYAIVTLSIARFCCKADLGAVVQVKQEACVNLAAQSSVNPTPTLNSPPTPASPPNSATSPNLDASPRANLEHSRPGTEGQFQSVSSQQEATPSPPQDPVTPTPSIPLPTPAQHQQAEPALVLALESDVACSRKMLLKGHSPSPAAGKYWRKNQHIVALYSTTLIGNENKREQRVGIDVKDLIIHSKWFAKLYSSASADSAWQASNTEIPVPLQTPPSIVYEMVEALYRGKITLRHDNVEQLLLLSHAMQAYTGLSAFGCGHKTYTLHIMKQTFTLFCMALCPLLTESCCFTYTHTNLQQTFVRNALVLTSDDQDSVLVLLQ